MCLMPRRSRLASTPLQSFFNSSGVPHGPAADKTLPDQRGSSFRQAYSVIVTLEPGAGKE